jgi:CheY-like chemotaxis protein
MNTQKTILVAEDDTILRDAVADTLRLKNFLPIEAKNGTEAVELALSKHPNLILLDLLMPEMDGMSALKKIRQDSWGAHVPVIILTNLNADDELLVENMVAYKPLYYLIKSDWKVDDVIEKIQKIVGT